ncbi:hypothetical protein [Endozoicomonas numazuensis]|uniref:hypothetical protein n=1 Tax=Endozoicomonas numazuensis TaxID=1137799 RepID=UPI001268BF28|nr:hypothetical protein [Endozoicomonas numazuensis]
MSERKEDRGKSIPPWLANDYFYYIAGVCKWMILLATFPGETQRAYRKTINLLLPLLLLLGGRSLLFLLSVLIIVVWSMYGIGCANFYNSLFLIDFNYFCHNWVSRGLRCFVTLVATRY